jgi:hypothetical protein
MPSHFPFRGRAQAEAEAETLSIRWLGGQQASGRYSLFSFWFPLARWHIRYKRRRTSVNVNDNLLWFGLICQYEKQSTSRPNSFVCASGLLKNKDRMGLAQRCPRHQHQFARRSASRESLSRPVLRSSRQSPSGLVVSETTGNDRRNVYTRLKHNGPGRKDAIGVGRAV